MGDEIERLLRELPNKLEPFADPDNQNVRGLLIAALVAINNDFRNNKDHKTWVERRTRLGQINWDKFGGGYLYNPPRWLMM